MGRKSAVFVLLGFLGAALLVAQQWQPVENIWTDKNNTEHYAAYLLSVAYAEHGYLAAKVKIQQSGAKRLFVVDPGPIFHVKEVIVAGPQEVQEIRNSNDAPKPGDIYSAARINEWLEHLRKQYTTQRINWGFELDHTRGLATIRVTFQTA